MKVVIDTNVLVSGLLAPGGAPGRVVSAWFEGRFDVALSFEQLAEIARVLEYPKIRTRLGWQDPEIEGFIKQLYVRSEVIEPGDVEIELPRDPDDAPILAAFVSTRADILVTGDRDLLALRGKYAIETPAEFVRRL